MARILVLRKLITIEFFFLKDILTIHILSLLLVQIVKDTQSTIYEKYISERIRSIAGVLDP